MRLKQYITDSYTRLEILFFITYYILFSVLSGLEFYWLEKQKLGPWMQQLPEHILYGLKAMLPGILFYKLLIQRCLFNRKYVLFLLGLAAYLFLLNAYIHYGHWLIARLTFLPDYMTANAARWFNSKSPLHFSVIYMFREFLVLTALAYFIRAAKQEKKISQLQNRQLQSELALLKAQVQPHFFFNTLNNIYSLAVQQSEKAAPLVEKYAGIMRHLLYNSAAPLVPLQSEIDFLRQYTEVEAVRYPDMISITFEQQGIRPDCMIEPGLLLPVIENVFKHGISQETKAGFVFILFSLAGQELSIEVNNSIPANSITPTTTGIGLQNVQKRLELLYPGTHEVTIKKENSAYCFSLTIQLKQV